MVIILLESLADTISGTSASTVMVYVLDAVFWLPAGSAATFSGTDTITVPSDVVYHIKGV